MPRPDLLARLTGGDRRSIGRADSLAALVSESPSLFPQLIAGLRSTDPLIRMRAADAAEKVSRGDPALLQPHKHELLNLMAETEEQELRWHLAAMVPRLRLNAAERRRAASSLKSYLQAQSSIVKAYALQGLAELALNDAAIRATTIALLRKAIRNGTPAMKARSRKLLPRLE